MIKTTIDGEAQLLAAPCKATDRDKIVEALTFAPGALVYIREELQRERGRAKVYRVTTVTIQLTVDEDASVITYTLTENSRAAFPGNLLVGVPF